MNLPHTPYKGWAYGPSTLSVPRRHIFIAGAVSAALLLSVVWQAAQWGRRAALSELRDSATAALSLQSSALRSELERRRSLPMVLAQDPDIETLLRNPRNSAKIGRVNAKLANLATSIGAAAIYIMDREGMTLAASNWQSDATFVGHNFAFRPYFQKALRDGEGEFFALGSVSQRAGFYVSHAVMDTADTARGVIVLKIQFDELVDEWRKTKTHVFVTDENGVVALSDQPTWQFRTLLPLPASTADALRKSLQFGDAELKPLPFVVQRSTDGIGLADVTDVGEDNGAQTYLSATMPVQGTSWLLHILTPAGPSIRRQVVSASLLAGLLGLGVATAAFLLWYRQELVRSRALEQLRMRGELERRVRERTADLTESYERLQIEIAERERVEAVLRRAQEELVHAEKLAALGQMAAGISHEVSQPLAAIRSYADNAVVLHDRGRVGEVKQNLSSIAALTERISQFMQHLKLFARKASGKIEPVSLKRALEGSLALVMHRLRGEEIEVIQDLSKDFMVWGEQVRIEQVLVNLLQNAADAMKGSSHASIRISIRGEDDFIVLTVADNGVGISPENLPKLFSAFFTTKNEAKGLGLGLYISRGIVEELGGALSVAADAPSGATFELRLRVADEISLAG